MRSKAFKRHLIRNLRPVVPEKQKTAATIADTAAQNANNAARSRGAMLLGLIGGPIGALTIGVAALTAGYMYLKSRTAEANAKLEEQGKIAQETDAELRKLSGNDKISAVRDLTAAFNAQNETLAKSKESVDAVSWLLFVSFLLVFDVHPVQRSKHNITVNSFFMSTLLFWHIIA